MRLLLLSTPVGPLGSGLGGGVELTVNNLARVLSARGHQVAIAAPASSILPNDLLSNRSISLVEILGSWQPSAQTQLRSAPLTTGSALSNMWEYARQVQSRYDLLVNFAYDWLPFYLTPFFSTPIAHFVSMGSLSDAVDEAIARIGEQMPGRLGGYTRSQASTFVQTPIDRWQILGSGIDLNQYDYCDQPGDALAWVGRISPEKGLEDAVAAATMARRPLKIFGKLENEAYWQSVQALIAKASVQIDYCGFLPTAELQKQLGASQALLVTPHWMEAFGIVAIEALACGVPVIAYRLGGPAEIVRSGETGWLVDSGDVAGLVGAIARLDQIHRRQCRRAAETTYSLAAWGDRFERWFYEILSGMMSS
ncbi:MAG: glycosyltransferase [Phormidesmis sp.]